MDIDQLGNIMGNIFGGNTIGKILSAILSIIAIGMLWWYRRQKVKISNEQTAKDRVADQGAISEKNTKISKDARKSEDEIEEFLDGK